MNVPQKKIVIIGGYGRAGRQIAHLLAEVGGYEIIIGGRTIVKAQKFVNKLQTQYPEGRFSAASADIYNSKQLTDAVNNTTLVIVCVPLDYNSTCNIIEAVLQTAQTHYIDLSPAEEKHRAFAEYSNRIEEGTHLFILDAGFEPGLPRLLAEQLLSAVKNSESLEVAGLYRDPKIPDGGIKDILLHDESGKIFQSRGWEKSSLFDAKRISFPINFGKALSIPIWEAELESFPKKYNLNRLIYYHAGVNGLANLVMVAWQTILKCFLPIASGITLYRWAIKYVTKRPYGCILKARATGGTTAKEIVVSHTNLYKATAIPVAVTARTLLEKSSNKTGSFYMGEWVNPGTFIRKAREMGLEIAINEYDD